jgi:hypothetical protein
MSITKDDIINAVADMSVMDVVELIEAMEEKFGVTAAAAVVGGAAGGDAGAAAEEKTEFAPLSAPSRSVPRGYVFPSGWSAWDLNPGDSLLQFLLSFYPKPDLTYAFFFG